MHQPWYCQTLQNVNRTVTRDVPLSLNITKIVLSSQFMLNKFTWSYKIWKECPWYLGLGLDCCHETTLYRGWPRCHLGSKVSHGAKRHRLTSLHPFWLIGVINYIFGVKMDEWCQVTPNSIFWHHDTFLMLKFLKSWLLSW